MYVNRLIYRKIKKALYIVYAIRVQVDRKGLDGFQAFCYSFANTCNSTNLRKASKRLLIRLNIELRDHSCEFPISIQAHYLWFYGSAIQLALLNTNSHLSIHLTTSQSDKSSTPDSVVWWNYSRFLFTLRTCKMTPIWSKYENTFVSRLVLMTDPASH